MVNRNCEEHGRQENGKEDRQEDEVRRRKKRFQREEVEENAPEENGISNRLFSSTFIPPLTGTAAVNLTVNNGETVDLTQPPEMWGQAEIEAYLRQKGAWPIAPAEVTRIEQEMAAANPRPEFPANRNAGY
jgi:hypothetical protein